MAKNVDITQTNRVSNIGSPVISEEYGLVRPRGAKRRGGGWRPDSLWMTLGACFSHALASWVVRLTKKGGGIQCLPRPVSLIFVNIKETEPRGMDSYPALLKSGGLPGVVEQLISVCHFIATTTWHARKMDPFGWSVGEIHSICES